MIGMGIVSWVGPSYISIRSSYGGTIKSPRFEGFKRGDKVKFKTNGAKNAIISIGHENGELLTTKPLLSLRKEGEGHEDDWLECWVPPVWEFNWATY